MDASSRSLPLVEGRENRDDTEHAAGNINDRRACPHRLIRKTRHIGKPTHHLGHLIEGYAMFVRAREETFE